jgi:hypothetical protein
MGLGAPRAWRRLSRVGSDLSVVTAPRITRRLGERDFASTTTFQRVPAFAGEYVGDADVTPERLGAPEIQVDGRTVAEFASPAGNTVVIQRQLEGRDVYGAVVKVHQEFAGTSITGDMDRDLRVHTPSRERRISSGAAIDAAMKLLPGAELTGAPSLVIFPLPSGGRWAYVVTLVSERPVANLRAIADAADGRILLAYNRASAATGHAEVYPVNPARTPAPVHVHLRHLLDPPGDALRSAAIGVGPWDPPPFTSSSLNFACPPTERRFDQPACYFHLQTGLDYFARFFDMSTIGSPPFRPILAVVNDPYTRSSARFVPDTSLLRFAGGSRPSARCGEIVAHELGHAVTFAVARLADAPKQYQCRGLSEGYSDYFASSLYDNPKFGDYVVPGDERDCSNPKLKFRPGFRGEEHVSGAVWAAILWDIRRALGSGTTDSIVAQSVVYLNPFSSFVDGLEALCNADRALAGGAVPGPNEAFIRQAFTNRI